MSPASARCCALPAGRDSTFTSPACPLRAACAPPWACATAPAWQRAGRRPKPTAVSCSSCPRRILRRRCQADRALCVPPPWTAPPALPARLTRQRQAQSASAMRMSHTVQWSAMKSHKNMAADCISSIYSFLRGCSWSRPIL